MRSLNKKGFMLTFLLALIFTVIIFVPSLIYAYQLVSGLLDSEEQQFANFAKEINEFAQSSKTKEDILLVIKENRALVAFDEGATEVKLCRKYYCEGSTCPEHLSNPASNLDCLSWKKPPRFCEKEACLCLFKDPIIKLSEKDESIWEASYDVFYCQPLSIKSFKIQESFTYDPIRLSQSVISREYLLEKGMLFLRNSKPEIKFNYLMRDYTFYLKFVRNQLYLQKENNLLKFCLTSSCDPIISKDPEDIHYSK